MRFVFLFFIFSSLAAVAADRPTIGGKLFGNAYLPTHNFKQHQNQQALLGLLLKSEMRLTENTNTRADLLINAMPGHNLRNDSILTEVRTDYFLEIREAYINFNKDDVQLKIGALMLPWGKSDGINPTDYLTAKNFTILNSDDEMRRRSAWGSEFQFIPNAGTSPWNFTVIALPVTARTALLLPKDMIPAGVAIAKVNPQSFTLNNTEYAGKISYNGEGWDGSLSIFSGLEHLPSFVEISRQLNALGAVELVFAPTFAKVKKIGGDFSISSSNYVFRLENAYTKTENSEGRFPAILPDHYDAVVGAERPLFAD